MNGESTTRNGSDGDYTVLSYSRAHRSDVISLHRQLLRRLPSVIERYFAWKYEQNPYIREPLMALVFHRSRLVGMRGLYGTRWRLPGVETAVTIPVADDLVVDKAHRDKGLFLVIDRQLARIAEKAGFSSILNMSERYQTRLLQVAAGWQEIAPLEISTRQPINKLRLDPDGQMTKAASTVRRAIMAAAPMLLGDVEMSSQTRTISKYTESIEISRQSRPREMSSLSATARPICGPLRDEAFYLWRWRDPIRQYRFLYWRGEHGRGYMALGRIPGKRSVRVLDNGATSPEILAMLLSSLTRRTRFGIELIADVLPEDVREQLPGFGFGSPREGESDSQGIMQRVVKAGGGLSPDRVPRVDLVDVSV